MSDDVHRTFEEDRWIAVGENQLRLQYHAETRLNALLELIERAQHSLKLVYYMFEEDNIGKRVMDALLAACKRGIATELIIDSFGSKGTSSSFFEPLTNAGGKFSVFSPRFSTAYFIRNHQKMAIADEERALIGGFNIADQYFDNRDKDNHVHRVEAAWEDLGLLMHGPEIKKLAAYFDLLSDWVDHENSNTRSLRKMVRNWDVGEGTFQWLIGGPSNRLSRWAVSIKHDLEQGNRLDLVTAYFSPGQGMLRRIAKLSRKGGNGRILLAGKSDNRATIGASRLLYSYLLKRGVKIHEYQPKRLHTKLVIVDDAVYIGSANFDLRSLFINVEIMLRVEDREFADHARSLVSAMTEHASGITPEIHKSKSGLLNRLRWTIAYFVVNTLDYTVTRRLNFGVKK